MVISLEPGDLLSSAEVGKRLLIYVDPSVETGKYANLKHCVNY